jgi:hypothetical protein
MGARFRGASPRNAKLRQYRAMTRMVGSFPSAGADLGRITSTAILAPSRIGT